MLIAKLILVNELIYAQGLFVEEIFTLPGTDGSSTTTTDNQLNIEEMPAVPDQNIPPPAARRKPVPTDISSRVAPILEATSQIEILYEVSSNGSYSNAPIWKLDKVTAQIRRYGELYPVQGVRPKLESMLAKTSPKVQSIPVTTEWISNMPRAFTRRVYRDLLYQVANATSTVQVDEILAESQRRFPLVLQRFYDAQARYLTMLENGNVYIGE